ncbi:MAG: hypothetical protein OIN66_12125 [Candidatus Methanoperedens sp.]|nr:hypothetical protein [Candidatus Methanoperedens sp.]
MVGFLTAIIVLIGIVYGYSRKGTEDYLQILKKGLIIGLIIGIIITAVGFFAGGLIGGIAGGVIGGFLAGLGGFAFFVSIVIITIEFLIGVFIGDFLERALK